MYIYYEVYTKWTGSSLPNQALFQLAQPQQKSQEKNIFFLKIFKLLSVNIDTTNNSENFPQVCFHDNMVKLDTKCFFLLYPNFF